MNKQLRIGVMGCANIAQRLMLPAIQSLPTEWELVGIASRTEEKAREFASQFGCEAIGGYDTLLERDDIDAIYMPLPTGLHREWIIKTLESGKHVYAEKSIAMHADEAGEMVSLAKEKHLALMEGYMFQYHRQHEVVKQMIKDGEIGDVRVIRASFGFPPFADPNNFRYDNVIGGGALKDAAGYVWRCINFLMGNVFDVKASNVFYNEKGTSIHGSAFAIAGNVSASISFGFDNYYQCNYEIWGSRGKLTCPKAFTPKPNEETHILLERQDFRKTVDVAPFNHFAAAMQTFHSLCVNEEECEKQYDDILFQSRGLDDIERMSKK